MPSLATEIDVINKALVLVGDRAIGARTDNNERARVMDSIYDDVLDRVLRECPWNFAIKRVNIASSGAPAWGKFSYKYALPSDFLYMMHTQDFEDYTIEEGYILADTTSSTVGTGLNIRYVARITDATRFDSLFTQALSYRLAYEACERLTQSNTKKSDLYQEYELTMTRAKRINGQEDSPNDYVEDDWITARY